MNEWSYKDLLELVKIKDKNIDHYLERITELESELERTRKVLDVARSGLIDIFGYDGVPKYVAKHVRQVLDQSKIETALTKGGNNE